MVFWLIVEQGNDFDRFIDVLMVCKPARALHEKGNRGEQVQREDALYSNRPAPLEGGSMVRCTEANPIRDGEPENDQCGFDGDELTTAARGAYLGLPLSAGSMFVNLNSSWLAYRWND